MNAIAVLCVISILLANACRGEDWPRFLGPRGDNTSLETGLTDRWTSNGPPILWEAAVGTGYSAPSVLGGQLVLHHRIKDQEIVESFDLQGVLRHNARFDMAKLQWLNWEYIRTMPNERYYDLAVNALGKAGIDTSDLPVEYVRAALDTVKEKPKTFSEMPGWCDFYFKEEITFTPEAVERDFVPANKANLTKLRDALEQLSPAL